MISDLQKYKLIAKNNISLFVNIILKNYGKNTALLLFYFEVL